MRDRKRVNVVDMAERHAAPTGREVHAQLNPIAPDRRADGLLAALNKGAQVFKAKQEEKNDEQRELGRRDSLMGKVDKENTNKGYLEGVRVTETTALGMRWNHESQQRLLQDFRENPDMDVEAWQQERIAEYLATAETPEQIKTANAMVATFQQNTAAAAARLQSEELLRRADNAATETFLAAYDSGAIKSADDLTRIMKDIDETNLGYGEQEARQAAARVLFDRAQRDGNVELLEQLRPVFEGDAELSNAYERTLEQAAAEKERRVEEERQEKIRNDYKTWGDFYNRLHSNSLTLDYLKPMVENGYLGSAEEAQRILAQQRERKLAEAERVREANAKAMEGLQLLNTLQAGGLYTLTGKTKKAAEAYMDENVSGLLQAEMALRGANGEEEKAQYAKVREKIAEMAALGRRNGYMPKPLQQMVETVDFNQGDALNRLEMVAQLDTADTRSWLYGTMGPEALAAYKAWKVESSLPTKEGTPIGGAQAVERLRGLPRMDRKEALSQLLSHSRSIEQKISMHLGNDSPAYGQFREEVMSVAQNIMASRGVNAATAYTEAFEAVKESREVYNGTLVPKGSIPENFESRANTWVRDTLIPEITKDGRYSADDDFQHQPIPGHPGAFVMLRGPYEFVTRQRKEMVDGVEKVTYEPVIFNARSLALAEADKKAAESEQFQQEREGKDGLFTPFVDRRAAAWGADPWYYSNEHTE